MKDHALVRVPSETPGLDRQLQERAERLVLPGERVAVRKLCDRLYVVEVSRIYGASTPSQASTSKGQVFWSGYIRRAHYGAAWWDSNLDLEGKGPRLKASPGGMASFIAFDKRREAAHCWGSLGAVERVFHTSHNGHVAVSNSPLLSHGLAHDRQVPQPSQAWLHDVIGGFGSISELTQFEGTLALPIDQSLTLGADGSLRIGAFPLEIAFSALPQLDRAGVLALCDELMAALDPLKERGRPYVRLSGGKDSRLLAALLLHSDMDPHYVTHGTPGDPEPSIAQTLADLGRFRLEIRPNPLAERDRMVETVDRQQRRADGLLVGIKQLLADDDPLLQGFGSLTEGQAHHQRGGYARPVRPEPWRIADTFQKRLVAGADILEEAVAQHKRDQVTALFEKLTAGKRFDTASLRMYAEARIPSVMSPYYRRQSRKVAKIHPFMDERVLLQTYRMHIWDLSSERAFFKILSLLMPEFTIVPLYDNTWHFDRRPPSQSPVAPTPVAPALAAPAPVGPAPAGPRANPRTLGHAMVQHLRGAGRTIDFRGLVKPAHLGPDGFVRDRSDMDPKTLWKLIGLSLVMRPGEWMGSH